MSKHGPFEIVQVFFCQHITNIKYLIIYNSYLLRLRTEDLIHNLNISYIFSINN